MDLNLLESVGLINLELHFFFFVVKRLFITSSSYHERF